ncbi:hypothetical protein AAVH_04181 [Aphelenchoides avenae]|nr:hypothetical protein AAVH_04181 [Aphelenchus avenae]
MPALDDSMDILWSFLQNARRLLSSCDVDAGRTRQMLQDAQPTETKDKRFATDALVPLILGIEHNGPVRESQLSQVLQMYLSSGKQQHQLET